MKELYINEVLYSGIVKMFLKQMAKHCRIKSKVKESDFLNVDWESNWIKSGDNQFKFQVSLELDKIKPNFTIKKKDSIEIFRFSPCIDFDIMCHEETRIFENIDEPVDIMTLMVFEEINSKQKEKLADLMQKAHNKKFHKDIKQLEIEYIDKNQFLEIK